MLDQTLASIDPPPASADRISIAASLHKNPGATIIHFELTAAQWSACGASRLRDFLVYWRDLPQLESDPPVLVFISLDADATAPAVTDVLWLQLDSIARATVEAWLATPEIRSQFATDRIAMELRFVFGAADLLRMEELAEKLLPVLPGKPGASLPMPITHLCSKTAERSLRHSQKIRNIFISPWLRPARPRPPCPRRRRRRS